MLPFSDCNNTFKYMQSKFEYNVVDTLCKNMSYRYAQARDSYIKNA